MTKIVGELQAKLGKKVDFDEAIRFLISIYRGRERRKKLFEEFVKPIENLEFKDVYEELLKGRKEDERYL